MAALRTKVQTEAPLKVNPAVNSTKNLSPVQRLLMITFFLYRAVHP